MCSLNHVQLFVTPWTVVHQARISEWVAQEKKRKKTQANRIRKERREITKYEQLYFNKLDSLEEMRNYLNNIIFQERIVKKQNLND